MAVAGWQWGAHGAVHGFPPHHRQTLYRQTPNTGVGVIQQVFDDGQDHGADCLVRLQLPLHHCQTVNGGTVDENVAAACR